MTIDLNGIRLRNRPHLGQSPGLRRLEAKLILYG